MKLFFRMKGCAKCGVYFERGHYGQFKDFCKACGSEEEKRVDKENAFCRWINLNRERLMKEYETYAEEKNKNISKIARDALEYQSQRDISSWPYNTINQSPGIRNS